MNTKMYVTGRKLAPYLFILPAIALIIVFRIIPIGYSLVLSTLKFNIVNINASTFIGFDNFTKLLSDEYVWASLWNTALYTVGSLLPGLILSLLFAAIICEGWFKLSSISRLLLFVPYILSITISGLIFSYIFQPDFGLLNSWLSALGLPTQQWLGEPKKAMWCIIIMVIWRDLGYRITIWSAGLLSISKEYSEAAHIDGASWLQEFFYVRLPLLKPVTIFLTVLGIIGSFQAFDAVYVVTAGGPARATEVLVFYLWKTAFQKMNMGYASAMAWLLFIILIVFTIIQLKLTDSEGMGKNAKNAKNTSTQLKMTDSKG